MQALEGVKVLDLTRLMPGPFCTMLLADMGAEVVRVEEPSALKGRRAEQAAGAGSSGPAVGLPADSPWAAHHRGKKSIVIDLKMDRGREIFRRLAAGADVLVEEMRPGAAKRLGIDYDTLKALNPRLVYCSITGFGQTGAWRDRAGHDVNYLALAGALGLIGERGGKPAIPLNLIGDIAGGSLHGVIGILLALLARGKTGRGQYVDVSITDGVVAMLTPFYAEYFAGMAVPERGRHAVTGKYPFYDVYETGDGKYLTVGCFEPWFYANLCRAVGREDLIARQSAPPEEQEEVRAIFAEIFRQKTRDEWERELGKYDLCAGGLLGPDEVVRERHFQERGMFVEAEHPEHGTVRQAGVAIKLSDTPGRAAGFPPRKGEHTDEVLAGLGYLEADRARLRRDGCVA